MSDNNTNSSPTMSPQATRRPSAAVIGSARASRAELNAAERLGRALINEGFRVVTGGLGGVMEASCRGARSAAAYQPGDTVGILPTYAPTDANPFVDVTICTGLNHARNTVVVASADVVIAVGGRSGTLSELAQAWALGRPVIAVDVPGWGHTLAGQPIDDRRSDVIQGPMSPEDAAKAAKRSLGALPQGRHEFGAP